MSIVIHQQPYTVTPAYNDSWVLAYSNQYTQVGFKYIVEVVINSETTRLDIPPRPDGGCLFNLKEIASNYIERPFDFTALTPAFDWSSNFIDASITITEYYEDAEHSDTTFNVSFTDACYTEEYFLNDYEDNFDGDYADITNLTGLFSVDSRVTEDTDVWLKLLVGYKTPPTNLNGVTMYVNDAFVGAFALVGTQCMVNVGAKIAKNYNGGTINVGDVVKVELYTEVPELRNTITYTITEICSKYPINRVYYYDRAGQIKYFNFELASTKSTNKQNNFVRLNANKVTTGSPYNSYGKNTWDREKHTVSTITTKEITLNSNWITESQSTKLVELFDSPMIWLYDSGKYTPVNLVGNTYATKSHVVDRAFNYSVTLEYSTTETRQRGI